MNYSKRNRDVATGCNTAHVKVNSRPQVIISILIQDLTRFAIQAKGPDGKWTRKPLAYRESNNVHLLITRPPDICVNLVFKYNGTRLTALLSTK